ncbi:MAG TPA: hypothetical protein VK183_08340 [Flavobacterium sp.]|nr:hypothetical protein [Flavobacterium sp.]
MKVFLTILLFCISTANLQSQNKVIRGRVISESFETMPGVSISINDSIQIAETDMEGFFRIEIPLSVKKLSFRFIGLETTNVQLIDNCDEVEIVMMLGMHYDFITPKKVDRRRKKRFTRLPELHKKAFNDGIFKTDRACYIQKFEYLW